MNGKRADRRRFIKGSLSVVAGAVLSGLPEGKAGAQNQERKAEPPQEPRLRLRAVGLGVTPAGEKVTITNVAFGSYAKRIGLESGYEIVSVLEPADRPSRAIPAIIALILVAGLGGLQFARKRKAAVVPAPA